MTNGRTRRSRFGKALVPSATCRARTVAWAVRTSTPVAVASSPMTGECSWTRTPRERTTRASSQFSFAGSTRATPSRLSTPPRYSGESTIARVAGPSRNSRCSPYGATSSGSCGELGDLVLLGGDVELPGPREVDVHAVAGDRRLDGVEVGLALAGQLGHLVGPARQPVAEAVGDGGGHEAAVAPRGALGDPVALEDQHVQAGIGLLGQQGGPHPGVAAAHDDQVGGRVGDQGRGGVRALGAVQPEGGVRDVGQRTS